MSGSPRRIIVVDPSLRDNVGHHIEYDLSLIQGAAGEGLEVVVLAHKDAARLLPSNANIIPVFSEDMWGRWRSPTDLDVRGSVFLHKLLLVPMIPLLLGGIAVAFRRKKSAVTASFRRLTRALRFAARVLRWLLPPVLVYGARTLFHAIRDCCERLPGLRWLAFLFLVNPRFHFELRNALRRIGFDASDLLFCHMATHRQLLEWGLFAASQPVARFARLVLLLRYPPQFYYPSLPHSQLAFRLLEQAFEAGKLRMATDSERLAREFADHTFAPFEVFPIPHTGAHALCAREDVPKGRKICIASLGNARAEKGMVEILDAVRMLNDSYDRREEIEFFLQLNDPDEHCAAQVRAFLEAPPANVRLTQTALHSEEYRRLLAGVDVVLVPYWGEIYASRTSGIFLEAVAAGKPVVATESTWMADELAKHGAGVAIPSHSAKALADAIVDIHRNFDTYRNRAVESARTYVLRHSPTAVLRQLVSAAPPESPPRHKALVVYPWVGLFERTTGAAVRTSSMIDTLRANDWEVAALLPQWEVSSLLPRLLKEQLSVGIEVNEHDGEVPSPFRSLRLALFILLMRIGSLGKSRAAENLLFMHRFWLRSRRFKIALNRSLTGCGAVFVEYTFLAELINPFAKARRLPLIVTSHDVLATQVPHPGFRAKVLRAEARALSFADLAVSVSSQDQETFREAGAQTIVVPNSVHMRDVKRLAVDEAKRLLAELGIRPERPFVVFFGSSFLPNNQARDILKRLAPELAKRVPGTTVVVAGSCAKPEDSVGNFHCLGVVSDEVKRALYELCAAVVIPLLQGSGTSLKTVEAFAYGRPVIGTSVAFRGLNIENRVHAVIQDDLGAFVDEIVEVLRSPDQARRLGEAARTIAADMDVERTFRPYLEFLERWTAAKGTANRQPARIAR